MVEIYSMLNLSKGIKVEVGEKETKIDVNIIVEYGTRIPDVAFEIQNRVKKAVETMTGLKVVAVNVHVQGVSTVTEEEKEVQDIIVRDIDCKTDRGLKLEDIKDVNQVVEKLEERLEGRFPLHDIVHPETGEVIVDTNTMINKDLAKQIVNAGITEVEELSAIEGIGDVIAKSIVNYFSDPVKAKAAAEKKYVKAAAKLDAQIAKILKAKK